MRWEVTAVADLAGGGERVTLITAFDNYRVNYVFPAIQYISLAIRSRPNTFYFRFMFGAASVWPIAAIKNLCRG